MGHTHRYLVKKRGSGRPMPGTWGCDSRRYAGPQADAELREAIGLQLNEMAQIADIREYPAENHVNVQPVSMLREPGFALAGNLLAI